MRRWIAAGVPFVIAFAAIIIAAVPEREPIAKLSAGAAPTLTAVQPNFGTAAGGWPIDVIGTGFVNGSTTITIAGNPVTSVTCSSSTKCSGTTPAFSTLAGSKIGQVVTVTVAGSGSASSGTTESTLYYYLPTGNYDGGACNFGFAHEVDYGTTTATGISSVADISGTTNFAGAPQPWVQATGADQPPLGVLFNGSPHSFIACTGSPVFLQMAAWGTSNTTGLGTTIILARYVNGGQMVNPLIYLGNGGTPFPYTHEIYWGPGTVWFGDNEALPASMSGTDSLAHAFGMRVASAYPLHGVDTFVDQVKQNAYAFLSTSLGGGTGYLCKIPTGSNGPPTYTYYGFSAAGTSGTSQIMADAHWTCPLSDADYSTAMGVFLAIGEIQQEPFAGPVGP